MGTRTLTCWMTWRTLSSRGPDQLVLEPLPEPEQGRLAHPCVPGDLLDGLVRLGEQVHGDSFLLLRRMFSNGGTTSEFEIRIQNLKFECDFIIFNCSFSSQKVLE